MSVRNEGWIELGVLRRAARVALAVAWLAACGGTVGHSRAGGESHFLRQCESSCGEGLKCISGICTRGCELGTDACAGLGAKASCTNQSVEPGLLAVCDVSCAKSADCSSLGDGYRCEAGFCRGLPLNGQAATGGSGGAGGGVSGGAGTSGGAGASGGAGTSGGNAGGAGPSTAGCQGPEDCPSDFECVRDTARGVGVCVDATRSADCSDGAPCPTGYACGEGARGPTCFPSAVVCNESVTCPAEAERCPTGFARSQVVDDQGGTCFGPCVEETACACNEAMACPAGTFCDAERGACTGSWAPAAACALPFDPGPCLAAGYRVFAFEDGSCVERTYGGCDGNENRFSTLDECLQACAGIPYPNGCPGGEAPQPVCIACGLVGGCATEISACPRPCTAPTDCDGTGLICAGGSCGKYCF